MLLITPKEIVQEGHPALREHAAPVQEDEFGGKTLARIISNMKHALDACDDGVAIAAPQIGVSKQIFIVSRRAFELEDNPEHAEKRSVYADKVFINPRIVKTSKKRIWVPEGCLSVRWLYGKVPRYDKATVEARDERGKRFTYGASGLLAQIFQHETDHLKGILFLDTAKDIEEIPPEDLEKLERRRTASA